MGFHEDYKDYSVSFHTYASVIYILGPSFIPRRK